MSINPKELEGLGINPFENDTTPEKLKEILPPDIDQSYRNYDEGYKKAFSNKCEMCSDTGFQSDLSSCINCGGKNG